MVEAYISNGAIGVIQKTIDKHPTTECGGTLLGEERGTQLIIHEATDGGPKSEREYSSFSPDVNHQHRTIEQAEAKGMYYLGEWHKHPGNLQEPSYGDIRTVKNIFSKCKSLPSSLMIIVVENNGRIDLNGYLFDRHGLYNKVDIIPEETTDLQPDIESLGDKQVEIKNMRTNNFPEEFIDCLRWDMPIMEKRFPDINLFKEYDVFFWRGLIENHEVMATYSQSYKTISVGIIDGCPMDVREKFNGRRFKHPYLAFIHLEEDIRKNLASLHSDYPPTPDIVQFREMKKVLKEEKPGLTIEKSKLWFETPKGKNRLKKEKQLIEKFLSKNPFDRVSYHIKENHLIVKYELKMRRYSTTYTWVFHLRLPENYPLEPPLIVKVAGTYMPIQSILNRWEPAMTLVDVFKKLREEATL